MEDSSQFLDKKSSAAFWYTNSEFNGGTVGTAPFHYAKVVRQP